MALDACGPSGGTPSFSIIIETENLANEGIKALAPMLDRLACQSLPVEAAEQVLVVDGERVPEPLVRECKERWPWIRFYSVPGPVSYFEAKQIGAERVESEVCVFVDCDVDPSETWLESILEPFRATTGPLVVAGETRMRTDTVYGCAVMMSWWLHIPSEASQPFVSPVPHHGNNFAAHRRVMQDIPLPHAEPFYRATGRIHWKMLVEQGVQVLKHPRAVVYHPPPPSPGQWFWRMLVGARDAIVRSGLQRDGLRCTWHPSLRKRLGAYRDFVAARFRAFGQKSKWTWHSGTPRTRFIAAIPIAVAGLFLELASGLFSCFWPDAIFRGIRRFESGDGGRDEPRLLAAPAGGHEEGRA